MEFDPQELLVNIRKADTDDLLDRITAYRPGLEPDAIDMIEQELQRRGIAAERIAEHWEVSRRDYIFHADGTAKMCSFCRKPAVREGWGWHKILGKLPVFPRLMCCCQAHFAKLL
jgi:hypothetical protein